MSTSPYLGEPSVDRVEGSQNQPSTLLGQNSFQGAAFATVKEKPSRLAGKSLLQHGGRLMEIPAPVQRKNHFHQPKLSNPGGSEEQVCM